MSKRISALSKLAKMSLCVILSIALCCTFCPQQAWAQARVVVDDAVAGFMLDQVNTENANNVDQQSQDQEFSDEADDNGNADQDAGLDDVDEYTENLNDANFDDRTILYNNSEDSSGQTINNNSAELNLPYDKATGNSAAASVASTQLNLSDATVQDNGNRILGDTVYVSKYEGFVDAIQENKSAKIVLSDDLMIEESNVCCNLKFSGTLDGAGHSITCENFLTTDFQGLFLSLSGNVTVTNLTLDLVLNGLYVGSLASYVDNNSCININNMSIYGAVSSNNDEFDIEGSGCAGLIEEVRNGCTVNLKNISSSCIVNNQAENNVKYAGGLIGRSDGATLSFENCTVSNGAEVTAEAEESAIAKAGIEIGKFIGTMFICGGFECAFDNIFEKLAPSLYSRLSVKFRFYQNTNLYKQQFQFFKKMFKKGLSDEAFDDIMRDCDETLRTKFRFVYEVLNPKVLNKNFNQDVLIDILADQCAVSFLRFSKELKLKFANENDALGLLADIINDIEGSLKENALFNELLKDRSFYVLNQWTHEKYTNATNYGDQTFTWYGYDVGATKEDFWAILKNTTLNEKVISKLTHKSLSSNFGSFLFEIFGGESFAKDFASFMTESGGVAKNVGSTSLDITCYKVAQGEMIFNNREPVNNILSQEEFGAFRNSDVYKNIIDKINNPGQIVDESKEYFVELYNAYRNYVIGLKKNIPNYTIEDIAKLKTIELKANLLIGKEASNNKGSELYQYLNHYYQDKILNWEKPLDFAMDDDFRMIYNNYCIKLNNKIYELAEEAGIDHLTTWKFWETLLTNKKYVLEGNNVFEELQLSLYYSDYESLVDLFGKVDFYGNKVWSNIGLNNSSVINFKDHIWDSFFTDSSFVDIMNTILPPDYSGFNFNDLSILSGTITSLNSSEILRQSAASLSSSENGVGSVHWNSYAGGFIANSEDCKISFVNCSNDANSSSGHNAGGFIALSQNDELSFNKSHNSGLVSTTDNWEYTAAGGFVGQLEDAYNNITTFEQCMNTGTILSHRISGGYVGMLDGGDVDIRYCGSTGGVAAYDNASGYVGYVDENGSDCNFTCCYSACEYDVVTTGINFKALNFIFLPDIIDNYTSSDITRDNLAGAFVGNDRSYKFENCYYRQGINPIGCDTNISDNDNLDVFEIQDYQLYSGEIAWLLDNNTSTAIDYRTEKKFGQVIDNFNLGDKQYIPIPASSAMVYKDQYTGDENQKLFTNYNPRTIQLRTITFDSNHTKLYPSVSENGNHIKVKDSNSYEFQLKCDDGYKLKSVQVTSTTVNNKSITKDIYPVSENDGYSTYRLDKVNSDLFIKINVSDFEAQLPKGAGVEGDPYIITNKAELCWFDQTFSQTLDPMVHVKLDADIDYSGLNWTTLFSPVTGFGFSGVFDGNGHTIKIHNYTSPFGFGALFGSIEKGTVKNLTVEGNFSEAILAYSARNSTIENCTVRGSVNSSQVVCGGLVAVATDDITITKCTNEATINHTTSENEAACGGIVGKLTDEEYFGGKTDSTELRANISQCTNKGYIYTDDASSDNYAGGIVGIVACWNTTWATDYYDNDFKVVDVNIERCENYANIADKADNCAEGGILGAYYSCKASGRCRINLNANSNWGNIGYYDNGLNSRNQEAGGMIGWCNCYGVRLFIWNCINAGNIYAYGNNAGGFIGTVGGVNGNWSNGIICNCASLGQIDCDSSDENTGSIIGSGYFYVVNKWRDNGFSGGLLTSAWCNNVYVSKRVGAAIDGTDGINVVDEDCEDLIHTGISDEDISSGKLANDMNEFYKNKLLNGNFIVCDESTDIDNYVDVYGSLSAEELHKKVFGDRERQTVFGQNIDVSNVDGKYYQRQGCPHVMDDNTLEVYHLDKNKKDSIFNYDIEYTNYNIEGYEQDAEKGEDKYYNINIAEDAISGQGHLEYTSKIKNYEDAIVYFVPDAGWSLSELVIDGENIDLTSSDSATKYYIFRNVNKSYTIEKIKFVDEQEPEYNQKLNAFLIYTVSELKWIAKRAHEYYLQDQGLPSIILCNDLKIENEESFIQFGSQENLPFKWEFNGQNHSINISLGKSLFNYVEDAYIHDLKITVTGDTSDSVYGGVARSAKSSDFKNVKVYGNINSDKSDFASSFVGEVNSGDMNFEDCESSQEIVGRSKNIAGFIANVKAGNVIIKNCKNSATLQSTVDSTDGKIGVAGAISLVSAGLENKDYNISIEKFTNTGILKANSNVAGVISSIDASKNTSLVKVTVIDSSVKANLESKSIVAGYIANVLGIKQVECKVINSEYVGKLKSNIIGGIIGKVNNKEASLSVFRSIVNSDSFINSGVSGGIVVDASLSKHVVINHCVSYVKNYGNIDKTGCIYGLSGTDCVESDNIVYSDNCDIVNGSNNDSLYNKQENYDSLLSGKAAYELNHYSDNAYTLELNIGQCIDFDGESFEMIPSLNAKTVYLINGKTYSNYENGSAGDSLFSIVIKPLAESEKYISNRIYTVKKDNACTINLDPKDDQYCIEKLVDDGDPVDVRTYVKDYTYNISNVNHNIVLEYSLSKTQEPLLEPGSSDTYNISNPYEFLWFSHETQNNNLIKANITKDINMRFAQWEAIGLNKDNPFKGNIDGQNHSINNLKGSNFIYYGEEAVVKDLNLNVEFTDDNVAGVISHAKGCTINNVTVNGKLSFANNFNKGKIGGGIVAKIENCDKQTTIIKCLNYAEMPSDNFDFDHKSNNDALIGGIAGFVDANEKVDFIECVNNSQIDGGTGEMEYKHSAGIIGKLCFRKHGVSLYNCLNKGEISGHDVAGLIGLANSREDNSKLEIVKCKNLSNINAHYVGGGIIGTLRDIDENSEIYIDKTYNYGQVTGKEIVSGFVAELMDDDINLYITNSGNVGGVELTRWEDYATNIGAGGFIGLARYNGFYRCAISNSFNTGVVDWKISAAKKELYTGALFGTNHDFQFWRSDDEIFARNFYSLSGIGNYRYGDGNHNFDKDGFQERNESQFISGQVAYELSSNSNDSYDCGHGYKIDNVKNQFNQIIDNYNLGNKEYMPKTPAQDLAHQALVYKNGDYYSNFDADVPSAGFHNVNIVTHNETANNKIMKFGDIRILEKSGAVGSDCEGPNFVKDGGSFACVVQAREGYLVPDIKINGVSRDYSQFSEENPYNRIIIDEVKEDCTIEVTFSDYKAPVSGDGSLDNPFLLSNYQELLWFSSYVNHLPKSNAGKDNAKLVPDSSGNTTIACFGSKWTPIGTKSNPFSGVLDGNGMTLSMLSNTTSSNGLAFVGYANNAVIKNLNFSNIKFHSSSSCAGVVFSAKNNTVVENVIVESGELICAGNVVGGVVGQIESGGDKVSVINCKNEGIQINAAVCEEGNVGGIIGRVCKGANAYVAECSNKSEILSNTKGDGWTNDDDSAGGIIGMSNGRGAKVTLEACINYGNVKGDCAGGMISKVNDDTNSDTHGSDLTINRCVNKGIVTGRLCGGLLGVIDDVDATSHLNISYSINEGFIGAMGTVLEDCGGLIGYINDKDLVVKIESSLNKGAVINEESGSLFMAQWLTGINGGIGVALPPTITGLLYAFASGSWVPGIGGWVTAIAFSILAVTAAIMEVIEGRMAVLQYAGGICGQFDSIYTDVYLNNVVNVGYTQGTNYDDGIAADFDGNLNMENVYSLDDSNSNHDGAHYRLLQNFTDGEIAYVLQNSKDGNTSWGQIIDDPSLGPIEAIPYLDVDSEGIPTGNDRKDKVPVYKIDETNSETITYSNYDSLKHPVGELNISADVEEALDESFKQASSIRDYVDVHVFSSNKVEEYDYSSASNDKKGFKYMINTGGYARIKLSPKDNKYSIKDVVFSDNKYDNIQKSYIYNDDGSIICYFNPRNANLFGDSIIEKADCAVIYGADGTVDINIGNAASPSIINNIHFSVLKNAIQVHDVDGGNQKYILWPYNYSDSLPSDCGAYYLANDVSLHETWDAPSGDTKLCLNGHRLNLAQDSSINVNEGSNLVLCDCNEDLISYDYDIDDNGRYRIKGTGNRNAEMQDTDKINNRAEREGSIFGGIISSYKTDTFIQKDVASLINYNGGSLDIEHISLIQSYNEHALTLNWEAVNGIDNRRFVFNGKIYGAPYKLVSDDDSSQDLSSMYIDANINSSNFVIKSNNPFVHNSFIDEKFENYSDLYFTGSTDYITFDNDYSFYEPLRINAQREVKLTRNIDRKLDINKVFESVNDEYVVAYCGNISDSDIGLNTGNQICLVKPENVANVEFNVSGFGTLYPQSADQEIANRIGEYHKYTIPYKIGSDIKVNYASDKGALLKRLDLFDNNSAFNNKVEVSNLPDTGYHAFHNIQNDSVITAEFSSSTDISLEIDYSDWESFDSLPGEEYVSHSKVPNGYKLMYDVVLNDTWMVPNGKIALDLNGHSIKLNKENKKFDSDGFSNINIMYIDSRDTVLTIVDSSNLNPLSQTSHYFKLNEYESDNVVQSIYEETDDSEEYDVVVKGGMIGGCNIKAWNYQYYSHETSAGAIVVKDGVVNIHSGNICGNNTIYTYKDGSIKGGSAVTVYEKGMLNIYSDANICANSMSGDPDYQTQLFAAAIASDGKVYNEGNLNNNRANQYSASAISINNGTFENAGSVKYNYACENKTNAKLNSFGTIFNKGYFLNEGLISENHNDFECAAVNNMGYFEIGSVIDTQNDDELKSTSEISNNTCCRITDTTERDDVVFDISSDTVSVKNQLFTNTPSVTNMSYTNNWLKSKTVAEKVFMPYSDSEDVLYAVGNSAELRFCFRNQTRHLDIEIYGNGSVDLISDKYVKNCELATKVEAISSLEGTFVFDGGSIDGNDIASTEDENKYISFQVPSFTFGDEENEEIDDKEQHSVLKLYFISEEDKKLQGDYISWHGEHLLPNDPGKYIFKNDITTKNTFYPREGEYTFNLNGHNILQKSSQDNIIWVDNYNAVVNIENTNKYALNYVKYDNESSRFELSKSPTDTVLHKPVIGNCKFTGNNYSGAIIVLRGEINLDNVAIACNYSDNTLSRERGKGASGLYVEKDGIANISNTTEIKYNTALSDTKAHSVGGFSLYGTCNNDGAEIEFNSKENLYIDKDSKYTNNAWKSDSSLPEFSGVYRLVTDVKLSADSCNLINCNITLDLNGHSIMQASKNKPVYNIHNSAELTIKDSFSDSIHKLKYNDDHSHSYTIDPKGDTVINGGVIGNCYFDRETYFAGAIINSGKLNIEGGSIVANTIDNFVYHVSDKCAAAIVTEGDGETYIGENASVCYNSAIGADKSKAYATLYIDGKCINYGTFRNNYADYNASVAPYITDRGHFENYGIIDYDIWESGTSLPDTTGAFRLQCDVHLSEEWQPSAGIVCIDLNGYNIIQDDPNDNVIRLNDDAIDLYISDYSKNIKNAIKKTDDNLYVIDKTGDIWIDKGLIGHSSHWQGVNSRGIDVEKGKLTMEAGSLVANYVSNLRDDNIGSALNVAENASAYIGKEVNVQYNYVNGNKNYNRMASTIYSAGKLYFDGILSCNTANNNAVAGIYLSNNNDSEINGTIQNNSAFDGSVSAYKLENVKSMKTNASIINNNSTNNSKTIHLQKSTIDSESCIENNVAYDDTSFAGVYPEYEDGFNLNFIKMGSKGYIFNNKLVDSIGNVLETQDLYIKNNNQYAAIEVADIMTGQLNKGPMSIVSDYDVLLDEWLLLTNKYSKYMLDDESKDKLFAYCGSLGKEFFIIELVNGELEVVFNESKPLPWIYKDMLPQRNGNFILTNDVTIDSSWTAPVGNTCIDLNGHTITNSSSNQSVINVNSKESNLVIDDTSTNVVNHLSKNEEGSYTINPAGNIEIRGGIIGGMKASGSNGAACINVTDGTFEMKGGNIAANNFDAQSIQDNKASAIFVSGFGVATVGKAASVLYNTSKNGLNNQYDASIISVFDGTTFVNEGTISNNDVVNNASVISITKKSNATNSGIIQNNDVVNNASVVNVSNYANFANTGTIQNNNAFNNSVAGVFVAYSCSFTNDGFIKANKAEGNSYILFNKAIKNVVNNDDGEICENQLSSNSDCIYLDAAIITNKGSIWGNYAALVNSADTSYSGVSLAEGSSQIIFDGAGTLFKNSSSVSRQGVLNVGIKNDLASIKFADTYSVIDAREHIVVDCTELGEYGYGLFTDNFEVVRNDYPDYREFFETDDQNFSFDYDNDDDDEVEIVKSDNKLVKVYDPGVGGRARVLYNGEEITSSGSYIPNGQSVDFTYNVINSNYDFECWYDILNEKVIDPDDYVVNENACITAVFKSRDENTSIRVYQKDGFEHKRYDVRLLKRYGWSSDMFNLGHSSGLSVYWSNVNINSESSGIYDLQIDDTNVGKSIQLNEDGGVYILTFDENNVKAISANGYANGIEDWDITDSLPPQCGSYKLTTDVFLNEAYIPAVGTTTIDLNGFNIIQTEENESAIYINDPSTKLIIEDTSFTGVGVSTRTNHFKKVSEDMDYYVLDDFGDIAVAGGIIGGCAFNGKTTSGAIVVEEGSLELNGGTIAANKLNASDCSDDVIGSAGLTVLSNGSAIVGKEATIALNSVLGNNSITRGASAAIYNLGTCQMNGWIVNNQASDNTVAGIYTGAGSKLSTAGLIESNFAYNNSCSAIGCSGASLLENKGTIRLNECYSGSCCVELNDVTLTNTGFIYNNVAYDQDSFAGVYFSNNNSKICVDCSSQIYDNKCIDKDTTNVVRKQDFIFAENVQAPIIIGPSLDINGIRGTSSIYFKSLNDNENIQLTQGYLHNSTVDYLSNTPLVSEYEDSCVVIGKDANGNDELFFTKIKNPDLITVQISSNDNSALSISGEMRVMKSANISIPLRAVATYYYFIDELIIDGQQQSLPDNLKTYTTNVAFNSNTNVQVKFSKITKTMSGMMPNIPAKISVTDEASLLAAINNPQLGANTEIRLDNDITLSKSLNPNENSNININLNGHILTSQSGSVITLVNKNCNMLVFDTSETVRKYQKNTRGDNNYVLSDNAGDIEIVGGAIYGGHADKGAGIYVAEGNSLNLKGANVIGCVAQDEGGAIYNEGLTEIDEWCTVAGNCAERGAGVFNCINEKSVNTDVNTMQQRKCGTFINAGNITFNTAIALHKVGLRYADCTLEGAGVYNKGLFNIKSASDISQNYIYNRNVDESSPLKRFLSDVHLDYEFGQNVSKIRLVGDLLSSKPYCLTVSKLNGSESAVITEGFYRYGQKINNEEFISTAGTKYRIFKSSDGELGIAPAAHGESTR